MTAATANREAEREREADPPLWFRVVDRFGFPVAVATYLLYQQHVLLTGILQVLTQLEAAVRALPH